MALTHLQRMALLERAEDTIHFLKAYCDARILELEKVKSPYREQLTRWKELRARLLRQGASLDPNDIVGLQNVLDTYGPQLREALLTHR